MSAKGLLKGLAKLLKGQSKGAWKGGKAQGRKGGKAPNPQKQCLCCGSWDHLQADCPIFFAYCYECGEQGHLAHMCTCKNDAKGRGKGKNADGKDKGKGKGKP